MMILGSEFNNTHISGVMLQLPQSTPDGVATSICPRLMRPLIIIDSDCQRFFFRKPSLCQAHHMNCMFAIVHRCQPISNFIHLVTSAMNIQKCETERIVSTSQLSVTI